MTPSLNKCQLTKIIKYGYRLNLQHGMNQFYNWTRYYQLVLSQAKCNTVTFSRKQQQFHAYVYQLDGNKLEVVHSYKNAPQRCKHNEKLSYINPLDEKIECNGDSDLENLDSNGNKIKKENTLASKDPKNKYLKLGKKEKKVKDKINLVIYHQV